MNNTLAAINIRILEHWALDNYLVLDYQTPDTAGTTWSDLYKYPDLAFNLPLYNFPNEGVPVSQDDLALFSPEVRVMPESASVGETVNISVTVRNFSNHDIPKTQPFEVRFYLGDPSLNVVIGKDTISGLARQDSPQIAHLT